MLNFILEFLKKYGLAGMILLGLTALGTVINEVVKWVWLTNFFIILRVAIKPLEFMWDFNTSFIILGASMTIMGAIYTFKAIRVIKALFD